MNANASPGVGGLRERRVAAGLSQQRMAELAGCSVAIVGLLEGGYRPERSAVLPRIVRVLDERESGYQPDSRNNTRGGDAGYAGKG